MIKRNSGFSLLEAMLTAALISGSALVLTGAVSNLNTNVSKIKLSTQSKDIVSELINTFSGSAPLMQVNYNPSAAMPNNLPIAWEMDGQKMLVSACPIPCKLPGRMGILITPTQNKRLFLMKVKVTHPKWKEAKESSHLLGAE